MTSTGGFRALGGGEGSSELGNLGAVSSNERLGVAHLVHRRAIRHAFRLRGEEERRARRLHRRRGVRHARHHRRARVSAEGTRQNPSELGIAVRDVRAGIPARLATLLLGALAQTPNHLPEGQERSVDVTPSFSLAPETRARFARSEPARSTKLSVAASATPRSKDLDFFPGAAPCSRRRRRRVFLVETLRGAVVLAPLLLFLRVDGRGRGRRGEVSDVAGSNLGGAFVSRFSSRRASALDGQPDNLMRPRGVRVHSRRAHLSPRLHLAE